MGRIDALMQTLPITSQGPSMGRALDGRRRVAELEAEGTRQPEAWDPTALVAFGG